MGLEFFREFVPITFRNHFPTRLNLKYLGGFHLMTRTHMHANEFRGS